MKPRKASPRGRVFLGMSGGVDSSVSAALLCGQGYEVVGVFIKSWEAPGLACTWRAERRDAMRVAAALSIPLVTLDLAQEYKEGVVDYFLREYQAGRTPNPDVMCNKAIKFGAFYDWARAQGADYIATGHYAQVGQLGSPPDGRAGSTSKGLLRSKDEQKDQTYFLWTLTAEHLRHTLFPIGHLLKSEVRTLAKKFDLPVAEKKDSQGVCFVGEIDLKDFLKTQIKSERGEVQNERGEKIGEHDGAIFYTIGERHGFAIYQNSPNQKPYYVIARDLEKNILIVSDTPEKRWQSEKEVGLEEVNWTSGQAPDFAKPYHARIRHRGELTACTLEGENNKLVVRFVEPPAALAPGQSLVLYDDQICLGGGVIA